MLASVQCPVQLPGLNCCGDMQPAQDTVNAAAAGVVIGPLSVTSSTACSTQQMPQY